MRCRWIYTFFSSFSVYFGQRTAQVSFHLLVPPFQSRSLAKVSLTFLQHIKNLVFRITTYLFCSFIFLLQAASITRISGLRGRPLVCYYNLYAVIVGSSEEYLETEIRHGHPNYYTYIHTSPFMLDDSYFSEETKNEWVKV